MKNNPEQELEYPCNDCNICQQHPDTYKYCEEIQRYSKQRHDIKQDEEKKVKQALKYVLAYAICTLNEHHLDISCADCPMHHEDCRVDEKDVIKSIKLLLKENF